LGHIFMPTVERIKGAEVNTDLFTSQSFFKLIAID
jgi:hypothetical protein